MREAGRDREHDSADPVPLLPLAGTGIVVVACCLVVGGMLLYGAAEFQRSVGSLRETRRAAVGEPPIGREVRNEFNGRQPKSNPQGGSHGPEVRDR